MKLQKDFRWTVWRSNIDILYEYSPIPHINYAFTARESSTTEPHSPQHTVMWTKVLAGGHGSMNVL